MARGLSVDLFGAAAEPPLPPGFILERGYLNLEDQRALRGAAPAGHTWLPGCAQRALRAV
jgi:hypothetical protein